jgi:hypothetical protein
MRSAWIGLALAMGLAGCANAPWKPAAGDELDTARMAAIERAATRTGVHVVWINAPRKMVVSQGS